MARFGASVEPLMPVDYAIGVGTFVPNNATIFTRKRPNLMFQMMKEKGIKHTTSECTLRGFTCAQANVDPKVATPAEIARMRRSRWDTRWTASLEAWRSKRRSSAGLQETTYVGSAFRRTSKVRLKPDTTYYGHIKLR